MHRVTGILLPALLLVLSGCAARSNAPRSPNAGTRILEVREGLASYYGKAFDGKVTASGARFDMNTLVAAHPTYPFGTIVLVTNLTNGLSVRVRVVDRGPAQGPRSDGVLIDLSQRAAEVLGFVRDGRARVRLDVLRWGD